MNIQDELVRVRGDNQRLRGWLQAIRDYNPSRGESPASIVVHLQSLAMQALTENAKET